ncbi:hypothetical protein [Prevotella intermedia]|nr:hypothetical protein [Prevotella intermedia]
MGKIVKCPICGSFNDIEESNTCSECGNGLIPRGLFQVILYMIAPLLNSILGSIGHVIVNILSKLGCLGTLILGAILAYCIHKYVPNISKEKSKKDAIELNERRNYQDDATFEEQQQPTFIEETTPDKSENTKKKEDVVPSDDDRGKDKEEDVEINSVNKEVGTPKEYVDEISLDQLIKANKEMHENDVQEVK